MTLYEKFQKLNIDTSLIGLEKGPETADYFCTPKGVKVIGWECGGIHYCFIKGYGETVFAVNPESVSDRFVYPLAADFEGFLRLILACSGTTAAEQIIGWSKEQFLEFLENDSGDLASKRLQALCEIQKELGLEPMEDPFEYVKKLQADFDYSKIEFTGEYYDVLGLEPPEGTGKFEHEPVEFGPVVFTFVKNENELN